MSYTIRVRNTRHQNAVLIKAARYHIKASIRNNIGSGTEVIMNCTEEEWKRLD